MSENWTLADLERVMAELFPPDVIENLEVYRRTARECPAAESGRAADTGQEASGE